MTNYLFTFRGARDSGFVPQTFDAWARWHLQLGARPEDRGYPAKLATTVGAAGGNQGRTYHVAGHLRAAGGVPSPGVQANPFRSTTTTAQARRSAATMPPLRNSSMTFLNTGSISRSTPGILSVDRRCQLTSVPVFPSLSWIVPT